MSLVLIFTNSFLERLHTQDLVDISVLQTLVALNTLCVNRDLASVLDNEDTQTPLLLIDTAGCDLDELDLPDELSKGNEGQLVEVKIFCAKVCSLVTLLL